MAHEYLAGFEIPLIEYPDRYKTTVFGSIASSTVTMELYGELVRRMFDFHGLQDPNDSSPGAPFLAVKLLRCYLSKTPTMTREKLDLVGYTALLLASKYLEVFPLEISKLLVETTQYYTLDEFVLFEKELFGVVGEFLHAKTSFGYLQGRLNALGLQRTGPFSSKVYGLRLASLESKPIAWKVTSSALVDHMFKMYGR